MIRLTRALLVALILVIAAPALAGEQSLFLVVSDFDAALQRPSQQPPEQRLDSVERRQAQVELDRILDLLRRAPGSPNSLGRAEISCR